MNAEELINNTEENEEFMAEEINQNIDLVGVPTMNFPEQNFDLNFEI